MRKRIDIVPGTSKSAGQVQHVQNRNGRHVKNRREFLKNLGVGAALFAIPTCTRLLRRKKPNFVFIFIDDLGWKDVGFMGSNYYETPHMDRIASEGIVFTNAYANAPNCAPSRACLLSGQYPPRHGVYTVNSPARGQSHLRKLIPIPNTKVLKRNIFTIAEALKSTGYVSGSFGKWHLGEDPETGPMGQGFDINMGGYGAGHPKSYFSPYENRYLQDGPEGEYLTDRLTEEALSFIEANKDNAFFLYLTHYAVHTPLQAKKELIEKYRKKRGDNGQNNAVYAAMIESTDKGIGRILDKLEYLDLTDDTVVILFSDNGGVKRITSMEPLRGGKGMLYEGGIRVPMVIRWPGRIKSGRVCDVPVMGTDFFPTFLEMVGVRKPDGVVLDGVSFMPLIDGRGTLKREALFWHFPAYLEGKAEGARDSHFRTRPAGAVRLGDWKLIEYFEDGMLELYNLREDVGEKNNLADRLPEKRDELFQVLGKWRKSVNAPIPMEFNPDYDPE